MAEVPRTARAGVRLILATVALGALLAPAVDDRGAVDVLVVLDDSPSAAPRTGPLVAALTGSIAGLPDGSEAALVRLAATASVSVPLTPATDWRPSPVPSPTSGTDVEAGLRAALALRRAERATALLLLSDGVATRGDAPAALRAAREAGVRVLVHAGMLAAEMPDAALTSLAVPPHVRAGDAFEIEVRIASAADTEAQLEIRLDGVLVSERAVAIRARSPRAERLRLSLDRSGYHEVEATVRADGDRRPGNDRRRALVSVEAPPSALFVTRAEPALAAALGQAGWTVQRVAPERAPRRRSEAAAYDLIVLDDVGAGEVHDDAWSALVAAVRGHGTGLIVGGGPGSFGAGAYRHSTLEAILPVTAERSGGEGIAIQFLVDRSGSMSGSLPAADRLAHARRAVLETVRGLEPRDRIGVLAFERAPTVVLALGSYDDPERAVTEAWRLAPGGGTRLAPALDAALDSLELEPGGQRVLVLVTDGFVRDDEALDRLASRLAAARITLVTVVVGEQVPPRALERLTVASGGTLLRVAEAPALPRFVRGALDELRGPLELGTVRPRLAGPLPFAPALGAPPALSGYAVSRAREGRSVLLAAPNGDPLLAVGRAGLGRVAVLTGGLGGWAGRWPGWVGWGGFAGGLADWVRTPSRDRRTRARVADNVLLLEAAADDGSWLTAPPGEAIVAAGGRVEATVALEPVAPGLFQAALPLERAGRYAIGWELASLSGRLEVVHDPSPREHALAAPGTGLAQWIALGLAEPWHPGEPLAGGPAGTWQPTRAWLLAAVLLTYLALLFVERGKPTA